MQICGFLFEVHGEIVEIEQRQIRKSVLLSRGLQALGKDAHLNSKNSRKIKTEKATVHIYVRIWPYSEQRSSN